MIDQGKKNVLGVHVNAVDYEAAVEKIISAAKLSKPLAVSALAVHGVMTGVLDATHRYRLNHLDLIVPDGQPVRWALNLLHKSHLPDRVYGPTLMLKLCEAATAEGIPIYIYGSKLSTIESLKSKLSSKFPELNIVGMLPSKFRPISIDEKKIIINEIYRSGAKIVFVGLGCPRQEVWIYEYRSMLNMPLIAVGAAFDFHAGILPQAPPVLQTYGLEWLFRLTNEPLRLWKRYLLLNPVYVFLLFLQKTWLKRFDSSGVVPPTSEMMFG